MSDTVTITLDREAAEALQRRERLNDEDQNRGEAEERGIAALRAALETPPPEQSQVSSGLSDEERERLRGVESALQQALMIVGEGLPGESERDSNMRIHAKWAVENALKDLATFPEGDEQNEPRGSR